MPFQETASQDYTFYARHKNSSSITLLKTDILFSIGLSCTPNSLYPSYPSLLILIQEYLIKILGHHHNVVLPQKSFSFSMLIFISRKLFPTMKMVWNSMLVINHILFTVSYHQSTRKWRIQSRFLQKQTFCSLQTQYVSLLTIYLCLIY